MPTGRHSSTNLTANPAEFFAVVTEYFFEQPEQLKARHPDLYRELTPLYRQDPAGTIR